MYVVREKKSKTILAMVNSRPGVDLKAEDVLPSFDARSMEFGRSDSGHIPLEFTIENGKVRSLEPAPPAPEAKELTPAEELARVKEDRLAEISRQSLFERARLIPDHEIQNAALGIYDDKRVASIRETVKAFRDEYKRLEAAIKKARSRKEVQSLEPSFPTKLLPPRKGA